MTLLVLGICVLSSKAITLLGVAESLCWGH